MRFLLLVSILIFICQLSLAQVDVSSELLLRPSSDLSLQSPGLESGRYKTRKPKNLPSKKVNGTETILAVPASTTPTSTSTSTTTSSLPATTTSTLKAESAEKKKVETLLFQAPIVEKTEPTEKPSVEPTKVEEPTVADQVSEIMNGSGQGVEAYKEQIHPDDIRMNSLEVDLAPGIVSNTSKSSYSFRNYNTFSPKILLGAHLWVTPFLGIYGQYTTTMGGDVVEDSTTRSMAQHEWTEIGFNIRKFFGMSRKSNSLQFGLHLSEYKFKVPSDSVRRVQLRSSGIGLHLLTRIPVAPSYSWVFGGKLIPRIQHTEHGTGLSLSSGAGGESTRVDLMVGGEFKLSRQNQILWDLTTSFEKNQFDGTANIVDPEKGFAPKGVSVENTFVIFSLGYRWGQ